jgi:hypothetical protein
VLNSCFADLTIGSEKEQITELIHIKKAVLSSFLSPQKHSPA